jgi:two-component system cell cycle response regulator
MNDLQVDEVELATAKSLCSSGFLEKSRVLALQILDRARARDDARIIGVATQFLANTCFMMGHYEAGIGFGREARTIFGSLNDVANEARTASSLALLFAAIGEEDATAEAIKALDFIENGGDSADLVEALDNTAVVLWLLHEPAQALPFAERAFALNDLNATRAKRPLINLAGIRVELAKGPSSDSGKLANVVADAVALTRVALDLARTDGDGWIERLALCNIAEYYLHLPDPSAAEDALSSVPYCAGEATDRCMVHYLHMVGRARIIQNRPSDAIQALVSCLDLAVKSYDFETAAPCYKDLSDLYATLGEFEKALINYKAFHDLYVSQATYDTQRRARIYTLEWEIKKLRDSAAAALQRAEELTAKNRLLIQESDRLRRTNMEDPLTGLQNRRRLDLTFIDLLSSNVPFAIAMIDIDHFKQVNDSFSHQVGDAVLCMVADLLRQSARADDVIARFGGDEFTFLLRNVDIETAAHICEHLGASAYENDWSTLGIKLLVTLSIGVAASHEASHWETVLALADQRLYRAKQLGRNRVISNG